MIQIFPDQESLGSGAARLFVRQAGLALKARGRFSVALSGGHTSRQTYELLGQSPFRDQAAWSQTHVFWSDERCVPPEDPRSNARIARLLLLEHLPIPRDQIHPIRCNGSPKKAAREYEDLLRSFFGEGPPRLDLSGSGRGRTHRFPVSSDSCAEGGGTLGSGDLPAPAGPVSGHLDARYHKPDGGRSFPGCRGRQGPDPERGAGGSPGSPSLSRPTHSSFQRPSAMARGQRGGLSIEPGLTESGIRTGRLRGRTEVREALTGRTGHQKIFQRQHSYPWEHRLKKKSLLSGTLGILSRIIPFPIPGRAFQGERTN